MRAERFKALSHLLRAVKGLFFGLFAVPVELAVLWGLPFLYLIAAYFVVDLPARRLANRPAYGGWGFLLFLAAFAISLTGLVRAVQGAEPVAPVRPKFAKAMFGLSFLAALLLTIGDLAG